MRILTILESPSWIEAQINGTLADMGHEVLSHSYGRYVGEFYGRGRQGERVERNMALLVRATQLASKGLDLIFCYVSDDFLMVDTARTLARLGIPTVNYAVDCNSQWYRHSRTARYFTLMLCGQRENMNNLARHGARVFYFPFASRPPTAAEQAAEFCPAAPVTFVGTPIPYRVSVLSALEQAGLPIAIYGRGWDNPSHSIEGPRNWEKTLTDIYHYGWTRMRGEGLGTVARTAARRLGTKPGSNGEESGTGQISDAVKHGFVPNGCLPALFRNSAINIGITRIDSELGGRQQVKVRDFEVPLAGGFYLVEETLEHREFFELGREIETWRSPGELIEKIRHYLMHEKARRSIAEAGQRRALSSQTWAHRFNELFARLGLPASGHDRERTSAGHSRI